ncbi:MAG: OsmC family protein [Candidatus Omnitrophica bacterium]|nr:OsmC family protein [Candidatus Omnitrophota bacterium]
MRISSKVVFLGDDLFQARLEYSDVVIHIDKKKKEIKAKGPNSLEMFLSAVGGCIGAFAERYLRRHDIHFSKLVIEVSADLAKDAPLRLVNIRTVVDTDADLGDKKEIFKKFISNCPVHNTLLHTKEMSIDIA